ncbi:NfeD family protein [Candidatus Clostridium radicumherbarum]|jgi:Membrane protein implicated in regulation of membrane protease activity|uniref:NfeD family protein n=1 Tax=Candidatus Clostridium radicumherbarum TaxID=3381662 RepID=A0ABW8TZG3_9CLOT
MLFIYSVIFFVGVIYTVVTFLLGGLLGFAHIDGHIDTHIDTHVDTNIGFHPHIDGHVDGHTGSSANVFPIKPITVMSLITVFGGVGMIGTYYGINPVLLFIVALTLGLLVSFLLYKFVVLPLYKAQNTSSVSEKSLIGKVAKVISPIMENGYGTIAYVVNGSKYNAPAQHVAKKYVAQGEEVIIFEIKNNVFYIEPLNDKN